MKDLIFTLRHRRHVVRENAINAFVRRLPRDVRRAAVVHAAVQATSLRPRDAYAGPDGLTYKDLWENA